MARQCPILRPTLQDLQRPFETYIEKHEKKIAEAGIVKIIAPDGWSPRREGYPDDLDFTIERPIRQHAAGSRGLYRGLYIEQKPMSLREQFRPQALSPDAAPPPGVPPEELERKYWRNVTLRPPLYGADVPGSLFDEDCRGWSLRRLDTVLSRVLRGAGHSLPGVSEPYLYFGTWRSTFAWHTEDMDLYSVNYLHFGAPKQWYALPPASRGRFERLIRGMLPQLFKACPEFFRHKELIISPQLLDTFAIPYIKVVQHPREFVITYPGAYHAGYNCGYNCAESVNFGTRRWVPLGAVAGVCRCNPDSVCIDMRLFRTLVPARLLPASIFEDSSSDSDRDDVDEEEKEEEEEGSEEATTDPERGPAGSVRGRSSGRGRGRGRRGRGAAQGGGRGGGGGGGGGSAPAGKRRMAAAPRLPPPLPQKAEVSARERGARAKRRAEVAEAAGKRMAAEAVGDAGRNAKRRRGPRDVDGVGDATNEAPPMSAGANATHADGTKAVAAPKRRGHPSAAAGAAAVAAAAGTAGPTAAAATAKAAGQPARDAAVANGTSEPSTEQLRVSGSHHPPMTKGAAASPDPDTGPRPGGAPGPGPGSGTCDGPPAAAAAAAVRAAQQPVADGEGCRESNSTGAPAPPATRPRGRPRKQSLLPPPQPQQQPSSAVPTAAGTRRSQRLSGGGGG